MPDLKTEKNMNGVFYMMTDFTSSAAALYDGGWRSEDKNDLIQEYDITEEEAETLCTILASYEEC